LAIVLGVLIALVAAASVLAHEGSGQAQIQVEPTAVDAGATVELAGSGLEPDSDRIVALVGVGLTVEFGTVTTDAEGMFAEELTIPGHLPSGNYELRAIGDETLTAALSITAVSGANSPEPADAGLATVITRPRSSGEIGLIAAFAAAAILAGLVLIWAAERVAGRRRHA
jgi:hypothetical protein